MHVRDSEVIEAEAASGMMRGRQFPTEVCQFPTEV